MCRRLAGTWAGVCRGVAIMNPEFFVFPLCSFLHLTGTVRRCPTFFQWHVTGLWRRLARGWFCVCRRPAGWWAGVCRRVVCRTLAARLVVHACRAQVVAPKYNDCLSSAYNAQCCPAPLPIANPSRQPGPQWTANGLEEGCLIKRRLKRHVPSFGGIHEAYWNV